MKYIKSLILISISVTVIGVGGTIYIFFNQDKFYLPFVDSENFKQEYESLNGENIPNTDAIYDNIDIENTNHYRYASYEEVFNILDNGTGIIYIGYNSCIECRRIVDILNTVVDENGIESIYYLDIYKDRDIFKEIGDEIEIAKYGTKEYHSLIGRLRDHLSLYKDKYLVIDYPTVIFVKEGKVIYYYTEIYKEEDLYSTFNKYTKRL